MLTEPLRKEQGFGGCVVSDLGAVNDRVAGVQAGLDLEMPASGGINDRKIIEAVREGKLEEKLVDLSVERLLADFLRYPDNVRPDTPWDMDA